MQTKRNLKPLKKLKNQPVRPSLVSGFNFGKIKTSLKFIFGFVTLWALLIAPTTAQRINQKDQEDISDPEKKQLAALNPEQEKNDYLFVDCTGFFE